jgi:hypothetical protein
VLVDGRSRPTPPASVVVTCSRCGKSRISTTVRNSRAGCSCRRSARRRDAAVADDAAAADPAQRQDEDRRVARGDRARGDLTLEPSVTCRRSIRHQTGAPPRGIVSARGGTPGENCACTTQDNSRQLILPGTASTNDLPATSPVYGFPLREFSFRRPTGSTLPVDVSPKGTANERTTRSGGSA